MLEDASPVASSDATGSVRPVPATAAEKVALFRSLFRGRDDVYPKLWVNAKSGRTGYAPACANEWVRGVCEKPRVRCGDCPNQAFLTVSDRVIADHLQGRHVVGVYPLLTDETCWFLAADFDKGDWKADASAFREACKSAGVPVSIERSRSGNGAHAWFFFEAPVPAVTARRMASFLLTQAMSRRHDIGMSSYDRLFPNQDTMPVSWRGTLVQYTGRIHRSHPGKAEVRIYDYVDDRVPVLARMSGRRLAGYRSIGYEPEAVLQSQGARDPAGGTAGYEVQYGASGDARAPR